MDKKTNKKILAFTVFFALVPTTSYAEKTLRIQTAQNSGDFVMHRLNEIWVPKLEAMTGGEIRLNLLPTNSVVPYKDTPKAVINGILDGQMTAPNYFSGKNQAFALFGDLTAGYDSPDQGQTYCRLGGGDEVLQNLYDTTFGEGLHVIGCGPYAREALASAQPINSVDDLSGIKIRAPEGLASNVFKHAGATPVSMAFSEVYTALETGLVDAADVSALVNNEKLGINEVAEYPIYPGIHSQPVHSFSLNSNVWESMSENNREIIKVWYDAAYDDLRRSATLEDKEVAAQLSERQGVNIINWSSDERERFREIAKEVWEEFAESSPEARNTYQSQVSFMEKIGLL